MPPASSLERFQGRLAQAIQFHVVEYRLRESHAVDLLQAVADLRARLAAVPDGGDPVTPIVADWLKQHLPPTQLDAERGLFLHVGHVARGLWAATMASEKVSLQTALARETGVHGVFHDEDDESRSYCQQTAQELVEHGEDLEEYLSDLAGIQRDWDEHGATDEHAVHYLVHERLLGIACGHTGTHVREHLVEAAGETAVALTGPEPVAVEAT